MTSDAEDLPLSPRATTPGLSDVSVASPGNVADDSFMRFMSRMVRAYMQEEEVRARHQAALLQLREKAIMEKTKVS